jgi:ABC-type iron transport system FetAB ATPase subunit
MKLNVRVESDISGSPRVKQLSALFDVPAQEKTKLEWSGDFPYDEQPWNVGLIVGPSGAGKSTIMRDVFGDMTQLEWKGKSVIDDFSKDLGMQQISEICQAVGFNTIPAWMRPFAVLSNGERFRVDLARRLAELPDPIVVDEFTSVVDRQVAKIGAHAVQKYVRRNNRKFVAVTCHYDVIEWLQPDWILEPATMTFTRRLLQRRPSLEVTISAVPYAAWSIFAPFHYMSASLHKGARTYGLFVGEDIAAFIGFLYRPHPKVKNMMGVSRVVCHPDWQGLGLGLVLTDTVAAAYKAVGRRVHHYPAHPGLIRQLGKSKNWIMTQKPANFDSPRSRKSLLAKTLPAEWRQGTRPNAVFEYVGQAMDKEKAKGLLI